MEVSWFNLLGRKWILELEYIKNVKECWIDRVYEHELTLYLEVKREILGGTQERSH